MAKRQKRKKSVYLQPKAAATQFFKVLKESNFEKDRSFRGLYIRVNKKAELLNEKREMSVDESLKYYTEGIKYFEGFSLTDFEYEGLLSVVREIKHDDYPLTHTVDINSFLNGSSIHTMLKIFKDTYRLALVIAKKNDYFDYKNKKVNYKIL